MGDGPPDQHPADLERCHAKRPDALRDRCRDVRALDHRLRGDGAAGGVEHDCDGDPERCGCHADDHRRRRQHGRRRQRGVPVQRREHDHDHGDGSRRRDHRHLHSDCDASSAGPGRSAAAVGSRLRRPVRQRAVRPVVGRRHPVVGRVVVGRAGGVRPRYAGAAFGAGHRDHLGQPQADRAVVGRCDSVGIGLRRRGVRIPAGGRRAGTGRGYCRGAAGGGQRHPDGTVVGRHDAMGRRLLRRARVRVRAGGQGAGQGAGVRAGGRHEGVRAVVGRHDGLDGGLRRRPPTSVPPGGRPFRHVQGLQHVESGQQRAGEPVVGRRDALGGGPVRREAVRLRDVRARGCGPIWQRDAERAEPFGRGGRQLCERDHQLLRDGRQ